MKTPKKTKKAKETPRVGRSVSKIVRGLQQAIAASNDNSPNAMQRRPSPDAQGLAHAVLSRIERVGKKESKHEAVAEMLHSALCSRIDRAVNAGYEDGVNSERDIMNLDIIESVMARFVTFDCHKAPFATMAITALEAKTLHTVLANAGFGKQPAAVPQQGTVQKQWSVDRTGNGDLLARHG